jgi:hypothetical protein
MNVLKKKSKSCGLTQSSFLRYAIHRMSFGQEQDVSTPEEGPGQRQTFEVTNQPFVHQVEAVFSIFRDLRAQMGKIGGNLNQAVRNMNISLKSGANSVSQRDVWVVKTCSEQVSDCIDGIWTGLKNLKQVVKKL